MRLFHLKESVIIDNKNGIGAVPNNQNVDYLGLRVTMLPSIFLKLAAPMGNSDISFFVQSLEQSKPFGAPFLVINLPSQWENGNFKKLAQVSSHEGRHRMSAIYELYGDIPVETHLFFSSGVRNRHLTDDVKSALNKAIVPESGKTVVQGPWYNEFGVR